MLLWLVGAGSSAKKPCCFYLAFSWLPHLRGAPSGWTRIVNRAALNLQTQLPGEGWFLQEKAWAVLQRSKPRSGANSQDSEGGAARRQHCACAAKYGIRTGLTGLLCHLMFHPKCAPAQTDRQRDSEGTHRFAAALQIEERSFVLHSVYVGLEPGRCHSCRGDRVQFGSWA